MKVDIIPVPVLSDRSRKGQKVQVVCPKSHGSLVGNYRALPGVIAQLYQHAVLKVTRRWPLSPSPMTRLVTEMAAQ